MTDQPYTPPQGALEDPPQVSPPQAAGETSSTPDWIGGGLALLGTGGAVACVALHMCACGHLAHGQEPWDVPLDVATFVVVSGAVAVLLLGGSRLRGIAALLLLTLLLPETRMTSAPLGLTGLVLIGISGWRGKGPPLTLARRQRG